MVEPLTIIAGIKQFGLAPDGSDLRDLESVLADHERQIAELRAERDDWKAQAKINECDYLDAVKRAEAAEAENARLRALPLKDEVGRVLEQIADEYGIPGPWDEKFKTAQSLARALLSHLRAGEQEGWRSMDSAPKDKTPVIIAVPNKDKNGYIIGEAYFDPDNYDGGDWWWAGTDYGDYHAGPISDINHYPPEYWQPLPASPSVSEGGSRNG